MHIRLLIVALASLSAATALTPHDPILIDDPLDLILPDEFSGNGIVSGSGTQSDPYIISGWSISGEHAIDIKNIDAYFRIENVELSGGVGIRAMIEAPLVVTNASIVTEKAPFIFGGPIYISASTLSSPGDFWFSWSNTHIEAWDNTLNHTGFIAQSATIQDNEFSNAIVYRPANTFRVTERDNRVVIDNNRGLVKNNAIEIASNEVAEVIISNNQFTGETRAIIISESVGKYQIPTITIRNNTIHSAGDCVQAEVAPINLRVTGNHFLNCGTGLLTAAYQGSLSNQIEVTNNRFDQGDAGLGIRGATPMEGIYQSTSENAFPNRTIEPAKIEVHSNDFLDFLHATVIVRVDLPASKSFEPIIGANFYYPIPTNETNQMVGFQSPLAETSFTGYELQAVNQAASNIGALWATLLLAVLAKRRSTHLGACVVA